MVGYLKRWRRTKWLTIADNVKERGLKFYEVVMHVVLQMSNLISIHNSKTVIPGASSTQRQKDSVFV